MAQNRDVQVRVLGEDKASSTFDKVGRNADTAAKKVDNFGRAADKSSKAQSGAAKSSGGLLSKFGQMGSSIPFVGGALIGITAGVEAVASGFINTSSRLDALASKSKTVFGDQLGDVQKWAKTNANAMMLTSSEAVGLATNMADLLIPMGFNRQAAADMAKKTVGLSGALSKWSGGTVSASGAADILTDAMLGETDGLKALGISISAAEIDAELLRKGQDKLTGSARAQAEAQATQNLIFAKSKDAQAGAASGSETLASRMESLKVKMREAWEQLVVKLTPAAERFADWIATEGVAKLQQFGTWLKNNRDNFRDLAVEGLTAAGTVLRGLALMVRGATVSYKALLDGAVAAFGWVPGLGDKLRGAQSKFNQLRDSAVSGLNKAADAADGLARKIAAIPDKDVVIRVREQTVGRQSTGRGRTAGDGGPRTTPSRTTPSRNRSSAGLSAQPINVVVDGRVIASTVNRYNTADGVRGR